MFTGQQLRPPLDPSGINIFRLHHDPFDVRYLMELPGRHDELSESYILEQVDLEWWLDRMIESFKTTDFHPIVRRNKIVDLSHEFHHLEYDLRYDKVRLLPNWPEPEVEDVRKHTIARMIHTLNHDHPVGSPIG